MRPLHPHLRLHASLRGRSILMILMAILLLAAAPAHGAAQRTIVPQTTPMASTPNSLSINYAGSVGGSIKAVDVSGALAYIGEGGALTILDIGNIDQPTPIARLPLPGIVNDLQVVGNFVYIADDYSGLQIIDVSDPHNPLRRGGFDIPEQAWKVYVSNGIAFVADWFGGLQIVDVSNPAAPTLRGHYDDTVHDVQIVGGLAYLATSAGLAVIDVSNPTAPTLFGHLDLQNEAMGVQVVGNFAYLVGAGLWVVNVSDPSHPVLQGVITYLAGRAEDVDVVGNFAYIAGEQGIAIIDVSIPTNPTPRGSNSDHEWGYRLQVAGDFAYLADRMLRVIDIHDPDAPAGRSSYDNYLRTAEGVRVVNNRAYVFGYAAGTILDLSVTSNPRRIGSAPIARATDLQVVGNIVYSVSLYQLSLIDIADPTKTTFLGSYISSGSGSLGRVAVENNRAYVTQYSQYGDSGGLRVIDISNPSSPVLLSSFNLQESAIDVQVVNNLAYVVERTDYSSPTAWLNIIDVSNPVSPTLVSRSNIDGLSRIQVVGNRMYAAASGDIKVFDVSNPSLPSLIGSYTPTGSVSSLYVAGNIAYLALSLPGRLEVVDLSNPTVPLPLGSYDAPDQSYGVQDVRVLGDLVYLADAEGGLLVLHVGNGSGLTDGPVSPSLSTVEASPTFVSADGTKAAIVNVTLRDMHGNPVSGKSVLLSSDRGEDVIEQPTAPTDANGQATGSVRSLTPGIASIEAVDMTDYVQVTQSASVQFTTLTVPPNAELRNAIDALDQQTRGQLGLLAGSAQTAGQLGDAFRGKLAYDTAKSAIDVLTAPIDEVFPASDDAAKLGVELDLPGVISTGWGTIKSLKEHYESAGNMFNGNEREPLSAQTWSVLTRPTLISGLEYIAAPQEKVEDVTADVLATALDMLAQSTSGLGAAGTRISRDIGDVQQELASQRQALLAGIPPMDSTHQHAYALDLNARRGVAMALVSAQYRRALYLNNLQNARASLNPGDYEFLLKFGANTLAKTFDGVGEAIVGGTTTAFDFYRHSQQVTLDQQGYTLALANLNAGVATNRSIYANTATGYRRIAQQQPPQTVTGQIGAIHHYSVGSANWIGFWNERSSYSDIEITNTSSSVAAFEVIVEYGYNSHAFAMPIAYVPVVDNKVLRVGAGQTATVRIPYKQEQYGGSPDKNDHVYFYVLGVNDTGMFYVGYKDAPWNPQRVPWTGGGGPWSAAAHQPLLAADTPTIENPINTYVFSDPSTQTYQTQIWINNPFTDTITTDITQALPSGVSIVTTDGTINGTTITWSKTLAASDITSATITFRYAAAPDTAVSLPPATMSFFEPTSGQTLTTQSNAESFNTVWPVTVKGYAPLGRYQAQATMPVTVTNLLAQNVSGAITVVISDTANAALYSDTRSFVAAGLAQSAIPFTLPASLPIGLYPLEIRLSLDGVTRPVISDVYQVRGRQVFLPLAVRRS